jgi:hypothetical protein
MANLRLRLVLAAALALCASLALSACGESSEEKAAKQVCSATAEITAQVEKLKATPISKEFPDQLKAGGEAIEKSINDIKDAAPKLSGARRDEAKAATQAFATELGALALQIVNAARGSNLETALKGAESQIHTSLDKLSATYQTIRQELKCS